MTLVDLLRDMGRAVQRAAEGMADASRERFLRDFDKDGNPEQEFIGPSLESKTAVPRASLRDQRSWLIDEAEIEIETDATFSGFKPKGDERYDGDGIRVHLQRRRRFLSTNSRLSVKLKVSKVSPPEGQSLILERLDETLRKNMLKAAITAPLVDLTDAEKIEQADAEASANGE